jgi:hypothetical protein
LRQVRDQTRVLAPRRYVGVGDLAARLANLAGQFGFVFHDHIQKSPFRQPLVWSTGRRPGVPIDQLKMARAEGSAGHSYLYRMDR